MEKIKKSFTKNLLPSVAAAAVYMVLNAVLSKLVNIGAIIGYAALPPLFIGFYAFLFKRMDGEKPPVKSLFDFYKSVGKIVKSLILYWLGMIAAITVFVISLCVAASSYDGTPIEIIDEDKFFPAFLVCAVIALAVTLFFMSMPYLYARNENAGIGAVVKLSFKIGLKYLPVLALITAVTLLPEVLYIVAAFAALDGTLLGYLTFMNLGGRVLQNFVINTVSIWLEFTAIYIIFERERDNMLKDFFKRKNTDETAYEEPFIEPYDFFIEADERFNDEKTVETENIRGVDILAVFDGMELADDIRVNYSLRRKLKKMFDDLAFEIGEYVTYSGGREIENDFTEEIDDRDFTVSVNISKSSDYEPFKLILKVTTEDGE
ncbi:MAG: hypothetical protein NC253_09615 [Ruminococcus sp.]|nr:hypothetical protein [Ruminococcus sp.]MCM1381535.1 hypothetical protein [Muribaculaceae bacterium]MCM1480983.1 hypothetical protein [Muribaculaceae bacterium]